MPVPRLALDLANVVGWATILVTPVTAVGVIVSAIALINQSRQARFAATLDSLWRFDDQLHGPEMRRIRLAAAKGLKQKRDVPEIVDVLNYFEMLGLIFRKGGIDRDAALSNFGYWVIGYWYACQDHIAKDRADDPSAWDEYRGLTAVLEKMDLKRRRKFAAPERALAEPSSPQQVGEFLEGEGKLKV